MKRLFSAILLIMVVGFSTLTYAALVDNGNGLIYDTDLDITWYDADPISRNWADSVAWAESLSVTDVNGNKITGWRLPKTIDGPEVFSFNGTTASGYNNTTSEMGHLYYNELGNVGIYDANGTFLAGFPNLTTGPFTKLTWHEKYWSGTEYATDINRAWDYQFGSGWQGTDNKVSNTRDFALAVHDGNVGAPDITPDPFTFTDQIDVKVNTIVTSNSVTVSGIFAETPITIIGGKYSINGGSYTDINGKVNNTNTVMVQITSSANYATKKDATLTIGGVSDTFSVTTESAPPDITPDQFTFTDQINVILSTVVTSNTIIVLGITSTTPITITGGKYSINGGSYIDTNGEVNNANTVTVQLTSSGSYSTKTDAVLTIGGVSDTFSVTTKAAPPGGDDGGGGGGCFIATAAFGSPIAGQVEILRLLRDRYLLTNAAGKKFVSWYYKNGPFAASWIKDRPLVKVAVQATLYPLIGFSALLISGYLPFVAVGFLLSTLLFLSLKPKKVIIKQQDNLNNKIQSQNKMKFRC